ncbi:phosphotransferase family protein [Yinghuangia sp. YIM S09857]|uniref:phosphotransferase family protein n=1 Tax=Yinghuangia sp. YIM S09857 TaxID=3436929 RepID=UPI003F52D4F8
MTAPAAPLLDPARLAAWLDGLGLAPGEPIDHTSLSGGKSNAMFAIRRGDHTWVLRRPAGVALDRAEDGLRREFRILTALADTPVPHPRAVAFCDDRAVLGSAFYLMARVDGFAPFPDAIPNTFGASGPVSSPGREIGLAMADTLADLHALDPQAIGLADLGRPEGFHERQVGRWMKQLSSYPESGTLPGVEVVTAWLEKNLPPAFTPVLMHGDYHFGNVLLASDPPPRVTAIVDWETATIGDPLLDLAGFLRIWFETGPSEGSSWDEMATRYATRAGLPELPDLTYYITLSRFRLAVLLDGIHQRAKSDPTRTPQPGIATYARRLITDAVESLP